MSRNTNFYHSFLVLSPAKRRAIIAVWDFCRAVDDTVDDHAVQSEADRVDAFDRLAAWRREIDVVFTPGAAPESPQGRSLQPYARSFRLPRRPFEDLVDGVSMDVGHRRYRSFNELYQYCYKVASTVGLICVEIFGCREAASRDYAVDLGIALQLTNILRDIKPDLARDRLYVPLDDLARFNVTEDVLREQSQSGSRPTGPVTALLQHQALRAREYYQRAARGLPRDDSRRLVAAEIMAAVYRCILDEIERRDYDVFSEIVSLPNRQRASIAARTWFRIMTGRRVTPDLVRQA